MLELNIGLSVNDGSKVSVSDAISSLRRRGFVVVAQRVVYAQHAKGGEDTLVVRVVLKSGYKSFLTRIHFVAKDLRQEAIAVSSGDVGWIIGPKASEWGSFDPYYFHRFTEREAA